MGQNRRILIVNLFGCIQVTCRKKYEKTGQKGKEVFGTSETSCFTCSPLGNNRIKLDWYKKLKKKKMACNLITKYCNFYLY